MTDPLIESLTRAVEATPYDVRLRTHLAELLVQADRNAEAVTHCAVALQYAPTDERARTIMTRALSPQVAQPPVGQPAEPVLSTEAASAPIAASPIDAPQDSPIPSQAAAPSAPSSPAAPAPTTQPEPALSTASENAAPESTPVATAEPAASAEAEPAPGTVSEPVPNAEAASAPSAASPVDAPQDSPTAPEATTQPAPESSEAPAPNDPTTSDGSRDFDWRRAEEDFDGGPAAPFVSSGSPVTPFVSSEASESSEKSSEQSSGSDPALSKPHPVKVDDRNEPADWEVERTGVCLADVGGMIEVKKRLEASFLAPMRNPELRQLYGKSLRGGLLLYGPPGTGKTFIARAIAGEMGAAFLSVMITDILGEYIGTSESNLHKAFQKARSHAPCVLFLDKIDALGIKRALVRSSWMRNTVNQLLEELDGVDNNNEGVYVLAATNAPWDIDPALRRPGRLDRTLLVLPPDEPARATILHTHLRKRPVEGIDLQILARMTEGLTGANLSHVCDSAAEKALLDSVRTGRPRFMNMQDMYEPSRKSAPRPAPGSRPLAPSSSTPIPPGSMRICASG